MTFVVVEGKALAVHATAKQGTDNENCLFLDCSKKHKKNTFSIGQRPQRNAMQQK
jgi:hypothetical protein